MNTNSKKKSKVLPEEIATDVQVSFSNNNGGTDTLFAPPTRAQSAIRRLNSNLKPKIDENLSSSIRRVTIKRSTTDVRSIEKSQQNSKNKTNEDNHSEDT